MMFEDEDDGNFFRGVTIGLILVTPFWILIGVLIGRAA